VGTSLTLIQLVRMRMMRMMAEVVVAVDRDAGVAA
jgi:hypothetical protein